MHGRAGEGGNRKLNPHMWTVSSRGHNIASIVSAVDSSSSSLSLLSSANSFCKDGRVISVGDCALFKPPQDCPPFIGIICSLTSGEENKLNLSVNWLYRPAEVKLGKGILLEAAPNEVFYSFHKDEIPAASLLHQCKVAFLRKGVELPSGISSYVCRRVYDITNKCLWWLTDKNRTERQEEVDQLLYKTRREMHATVHTGGRSPKPMNGPTSTSHVKPSSDDVHNTVSSFHSQVKGKKREHGDHGYEPKRERFSKTDDEDSGHCRSESSFKSEISKLVERGGITDYDGVEKLVQLMLSEREAKKIDLACRSMLAGVIAATDKFEYLSRFVQLKGLPVLDEWLQEFHKGKIGEGSGSKDGDKAVEEFLLVLLRALDKLPINLQALQMCNIGKSVNHLRSHRNLDIQKKARSLVDMWKKRVEADMNIKDAKIGSSQGVPWSARPRLSEVSHGGNRHSARSSEVAVKSAVTQFSGSKTGPVKLIQGETTVNLANSSPAPFKVVSPPASADSKDRQPWSPAMGGTPDLPLSTVKDEKSSNSNQSNNSQSSTGDHGKIGGMPRKEDSKNTTTGSVSVNKVSGGSSRHQKSINELPGVGLSVVQREIGTCINSPFHINPPLEKVSESGLTRDEVLDASVNEGSNKLTVKISDQNHTLAECASGGSLEYPSVMKSRASSPAFSEKHEQFDHSSKEKIDSYRANTPTYVINESWQSNDTKDVLTCSDEGDGSPAAVLVEERCRIGGDARNMDEASKATSSLAGTELNPEKIYDKAYLNSINALIDSCAKYSDTNASPSTGEDVGMNLLASVAAGEICKSEQVPPPNSLQRRPLAEHSCGDTDSKTNSSPLSDLAQKQTLSTDVAVYNQEKHITVKSEETLAVEHNVCAQNRDQGLGSNGKLNEAEIPSCSVDGTTNNEGDKPKEEVVDGVTALSITDGRQKVPNSSLASDKGNAIINSEQQNNRGLNEGLKGEAQTVQKSPAMIMNTEMLKATNEEALIVLDPAPDNIAMLKPISGAQTDAQRSANRTARNRAELESNASKPSKDQASESSGTNCKGEFMVENPEKREAQERQSSGTASHVLSPTFPMDNTEQCSGAQRSKLTGTIADECTSTTADPSSVSAAGRSDMDAKVEFDLNEGFNADDGNYVEQLNIMVPDSAAVQLISPLPFPVSSVSTSLPASITVTAATKGPFVPSEDLLRSKGELGWKGSAATSAFRPAEPRKIVEVSTNFSLPGATTAKCSRLPFDIDLNVPDDTTLADQEMVSVSDHTNEHDSAKAETVFSARGRGSGGLELDLNQIDEATDMVNCSTSNGHRLDIPLLPAKSLSDLPNGNLSVNRDFDLNDGPVVDDVSTGQLPFNRLYTNAMPSQHPGFGLRMNNTELGNFSSWFPPGNSYSTVSVPSSMPERVDLSFPVTSGRAQRMLVPPSGSSAFSPDIYRGPVLSSSPAMPFQSTPWQYPVFPFGTSFPLPSATFPVVPESYMDPSSTARLCYPSVPSQFLGSAGAVSSNYQRPYLIGVPDGSNNGSVESSRKWGRQGLDLNSGPGSLDIGGDDTSPLALRQLSTASSQSLAEEQARMYQGAGGGLKRKEPEGGWENYKQSSWPENV